MTYSEEYKKEVGRRIALSRVRAGLSQKALSIIMGCNQAEVAYYETGKRLPMDKTLMRLADKLELDYAWLKHGDETYYNVEQLESGKAYTINHIPGDQVSSVSVSKMLKELDDDELVVVSELCELLMLEKDQDKKNSYFKQKEEKYKEDLKLAKTQTKKETASSAAANELASMYEFYPEEFMRMIKKEIDLDQARELTWFKELDKYPRLKKQYEKNPEDLETKHRTIDEIIKSKEKEAKSK